MSRTLGAHQGAGQAVVAAANAKAVTAEVEADLGERMMNRLTTGGMVMGLFEHCVYEQETIQMERGGISSLFASRSTRRIDSGAIVGYIDIATVSGPRR